MARPAVQGAVFMGQVMEVAALVQDSKAIKPDMATKVVRVTRAVTIITHQGVSSSNNRVIRVIRSS